MSQDLAVPPPAQRSIELAISGMTCGSCAVLIEKKLRRLGGVEASINYATEKAQVHLPLAMATQEIVAAIEAVGGYTVRLLTADAAAGSTETQGGNAAPQPEEPDPAAPWRLRLIVCTLLSVPVIVMSMIPGATFTYWQWASLALAAPVAVWGALPFHRAAWINFRHGVATMDTLISVGVSAAFGWSLYALFSGGAGAAESMGGFELLPRRGGEHAEIYLEVAAGLTAAIVAGRFFEARARRRSGEALRALMDLGAKDVAVLRDGVERRIPIEDLVVGDEFVTRPGEKVATDGVVVSGSSAIDAALVTGDSVPVEVGPGDAVIGATVNVGGRVVIRATKVGADTALAQIARLVDDAQNGKAAVQRLADRVSGVFVPIVIALAVGTLGYWVGTGATSNTVSPRRSPC